MATRPSGVMGTAGARQICIAARPPFAWAVYENYGHSHTLKAAEVARLRFRAPFAAARTGYPVRTWWEGQIPCDIGQRLEGVRLCLRSLNTGG
jgi:hypothetical protein